VILLLDNYDSFVYNLSRYVRELGEHPVVIRNDAISVEAVRALAPSHIIVSPGPCTPNEAGISVDLVSELGHDTPILGVCLGHQAIGAAFGAEIIRAPKLMHGKTSPIEHDNRSVFRDLPQPMTCTRYHSLIVREDSIPDELEISARVASGTGAPDPGTVMGLRHKTLPIEGVQFHPESVLTDHGKRLIANFLTQ